MFCSKCGKELLDEAVICPGCGCPTINYYKNQPATSAAAQYTATVDKNSEAYPQVREFAERVKTIHLFAAFGVASIFGFSFLAVFVLGMGAEGGILCSIVGAVLAAISGLMERKTKIPELSLMLPSEISEFASAKRKLETAKKLNTTTIVVMAGIVVLIAVVSIIK